MKLFRLVCRSLIVSVAVVAVGLLNTAPALADGTGEINVNLPGSYPVSTYGPAGAVANFYQFALMMGGLLAFGVIVWGGIRYTLASGNPSTQSDARDQITQALLGLLLLVGVYLVLTIINPNLTKLGLPTLPALQVPTSTTAGSVGGGGSCVVSDSGPCSYDTLAACSSWDTVKASGICNVESGQGNLFAQSGSDKCQNANDKSFSLGLFQINMIANQSRAPASCQGIFTVPPGSATGQGNCLDCRKGGTGAACTGGLCVKWSCTFTGTDDAYTQCLNDLADPNINIGIACSLYNGAGGSFKPWQYTAVNVCGFPP